MRVRRCLCYFVVVEIFAYTAIAICDAPHLDERTGT